MTVHLDLDMLVEMLLQFCANPRFWRNLIKIL